MAGMSGDVLDILEVEKGRNSPQLITKEQLLNDKKKPKIVKETVRKPQGMNREVWGLLWNDDRDKPPLIPLDTSQGYQQMKAKLGRRRVRPWKWMPFANPSRTDGAIFYHWRRIADEGKEYPFSRFNKRVETPTFSEAEYQQHMNEEGWTKAETEHLFELCRQYDLRFLIVHDRYDHARFPKRTLEDLKERYYGVCNSLAQGRATAGYETKVFDAEHERRRKEQLLKLYNRTQDQIEEEQMLVDELRKIEQRKKEREKKTQDLQKLISAADTSMDARRTERKSFGKKKTQFTALDRTPGTPEGAAIRFPEFKSAGVHLRSQRMKLPANVGTKRTKAIESLLEELGIDAQPMPTDDICQHFNDLRSDMVLLYELKIALNTCEFDLQSQRHRYETLAPGMSKSLDVPVPTPTSAPVYDEPCGSESSDSPRRARRISEIIDIQDTPGERKRKASLNQSNILKKLKGK